MFSNLTPPPALYIHVNALPLIARTFLLLLALPLCAQAETTRESAEQRRILNEGYSMLYKDARTIGAVKYLLWVKIESDEFDLLITEVTDFGNKLHDDLGKLATQYPALRLDLDPLPVMEKRKRLATGFDKFYDIAPLTGKSGHQFERVLLNSLTNGLNQERHLADELAKEEPDPGLKKFMQQTKSRMDALYKSAEFLLERKYFK